MGLDRTILTSIGVSCSGNKNPDIADGANEMEIIEDNLVNIINSFNQFGNFLFAQSESIL